MAERWVVNASPVILLAKAGVVQFLPGLCAELVIPNGVVSEVQEGHKADEGHLWLASAGARYVRPSGQLHPALALWSGGTGEAEVISWALAHPDFTAVLDDRAARGLARRNGVKVIGSLRVIVMAKERGFIPLARPALEKLRGAGAYVSDELIDLAINLARE